jgi:hypothetical protein
MGAKTDNFPSKITNYLEILAGLVILSVKDTNYNHSSVLAIGFLMSTPRYLITLSGISLISSVDVPGDS